MFLGISVMFGLVMIKLFKLQVVEHDSHVEELRYSTERKVETAGIRGLIFDRYGRPLATNKPVYTLKIDQQVKMPKKDLNKVILEVCKILEANGDTYMDTIPISKTAPFIFTESESVREKFISSIPYDGREHREKLLTHSAEELFEYLKSDDVFQIEDCYTDEEARKIIAVRHQMYQGAYQKYKPITIAEDISKATQANISERQAEYQNIFIEAESYRYYPYGEVLGNILGYTRTITNKQFEQMENLGYENDDIIGQMGIEQTMEETLRGKSGHEIIAVDNVGRKVHTLESTQAVSGNDIFLTIDANIQLKVYEAIEKRLSEAIIQRIQGGAKDVAPLSPREILVSMVENNQIDIKKMKEAKADTMQYELSQKLNKWYEESLKDRQHSEKIKGLTLKEFLVLLLKQDQALVSDRELLLVLIEQGKLKLDDKLVQRIWAGNQLSIASILIDALKSGSLKPNQMAIAPFSASAVVIETGTGNVLAAVGYPSYDSNEMTTNFNTYYSNIQDGMDQRNLLWNRALMTAKAPGSTFKMISALAGLEEGVVTTSTIINDIGPYTKAGTPHPRCWFFTNNGYGHGAADIHRALEVSCNYYFYELAYRLGLKYGVPYGAIDVFSKYAQMFGLDKKTGIELPEVSPNVSNPDNMLKSNISKALNVIRNASDVGQKVFNNLVIEQVEKGIYPYANSKSKDFHGKLEYQVQKQIKKKVDSYFKDSTEAFTKINQSLINDLQLLVKDDVTAITQRLSNDILLDDTDRSLTIKTKEAVGEFLEANISSDTYNLILNEVNKIGTQKIKKLYVKTFEDVIRSNKSEIFSPKEISNISEIIKALEENKLEGATFMADRIKTHLIENLVVYLFDNADLEWTNAINVRTAIGQGNNAFTPIQMARYIAGIANGRQVFDLKIVGGVMDQDGDRGYEAFPSKVFGELKLKDTSLNAVHEGMYRVVNGKEGSARNAFVDSKVAVAGKTGTAEEASTEHSWFAGFAPYDNPEIAVVTTMYDATGLGKYNYLLASDIFNAVLAPKPEKEKATMDTIFTY